MQIYECKIGTFSFAFEAYSVCWLGVCMVVGRVVKLFSKFHDFHSVQSIISKFGTLVLHIDAQKPVE